ncbi:MAG TPA: MFS transporter [Geopsychrobacteraceae bacterium]|nr:MFS transporter [Geopsychrobacteraceae bacterium]
MPEKQRQARIGWCLYDWANSAFATVILAAVLPVYFVALVPEDGAIIGVGSWQHTLPASALWGYAVSGSMLIVAVIGPWLGALADHRGLRKQFLVAFCLVGSFATSLLYLTSHGQYLTAAALFIIGNIGFSAGNIFYNAYLAILVKPGGTDRLSAQGFATGYIGGGIVLLAVFLLIQFSDQLGFADKGAATRLGFLFTGLWWALFALPAFFLLPKTDPSSRTKANPFRTYLNSFKDMIRYRDLSLFLLAFLFYNDGIQTVIAVSAIFAREELALSQGTILGCFLMIQFAAMPGALLFGRIADRFGAKQAILLSLFLFTLVCGYAYTMRSSLEFWVLGAVIALILGGSQAISRSLFASMVPIKRSAEFFGFYSISARFASIFGPLTFALVTDLTGSSRGAILALAIFFVIGGGILLLVNVDRGRIRAVQN